jgi:hypothetical protein
VDRVLRYGNHYLPSREDGLAERIADLRSRSEELGRPRPDVSYFGAQIDAGVVERLTAAGVDRIAFSLPSAGRPEVEAALDRAAALTG